jgi:SpoVK/Ycf46/Vps4 family AAA+-type ATPase
MLGMSVLGYSESPKKIFIRDDVRKQWEFLDKVTKFSLITGPPGTGKSTLAWAWLLAQQSDFVWFHFNSVTTVLPQKIFKREKGVIYNAICQY